MSKKRKTREMAIQALYLWDTHGEKAVELARQSMVQTTDDPAVVEQALQLAGGAWDQISAMDKWLERLAPQWPPRRQPAVDRAILRLAIFELTNTQTPPKVVIDEAIELAKEYSTENSAAFVNGVLDAVLKEMQSLTQL